MLFSRLRPHFPLFAPSEKFATVGHTAGPAVTACHCLRFIRVSKNVPPFACCNSDTRERILIFFLVEMLLIN